MNVSLLYECFKKVPNLKRARKRGFSLVIQETVFFNLIFHKGNNIRKSLKVKIQLQKQRKMAVEPTELRTQKSHVVEDNE